MLITSSMLQCVYFCCISPQYFCFELFHVYVPQHTIFKTAWGVILQGTNAFSDYCFNGVFFFTQRVEERERRVKKKTGRVKRARQWDIQTRHRWHCHTRFIPHFLPRQTEFSPLVLHKKAGSWKVSLSQWRRRKANWKPKSNSWRTNWASWTPHSLTRLKTWSITTMWRWRRTSCSRSSWGKCVIAPQEPPSVEVESVAAFNKQLHDLDFI